MSYTPRYQKIASPKTATATVRKDQRRAEALREMDAAADKLLQQLMKPEPMAAEK